MTVYENINKLQKNNLLKASIKNGIISPIYIDYIKIYEDYLIERKQGINKMQCYCNASEKYYISETTVRKIVKLMQR